MAFSDDFSAYPQNECIAEGQQFGFWTSVFAGYGCNSIVDNGGTAALSLAPEASTADGETHSALVLGPAYEGDVRFGAGVTTVQQLRQGSPPNPWEVGWLIWHYTDDAHFYYFIAKPNGWELGKLDPAYTGGQRFLQTGEDPQFPLGVRKEINVVHRGAKMTVNVNGADLAEFTDQERPYAHGKIGFYAEDAIALYDTVSAAGA